MPTQAKKHLIMKNNLMQLVEVDHHKFAVEVVNGTVRGNLTQMAKPFDVKPDAWLKTDAAKRYLFALSKSKIFDLLSEKMTVEKLITVKHGGSIATKGTWANHHNIVIEFARWLSPEFSIEVNELIYKLLTNQAAIASPFMGVEPIIHNNRSYYYYRGVLKAIGYSLKSGSVAKRKTQNEKHFIKEFGRNFIDLEFCQRLKEEAVKYGIQLELPFEARLLEGGENA